MTTIRIPLAPCFALCFALLLAPPAASYPIRPVPLWSLTAKADLIVVAKVTEVVELPDPDYSQEEWASDLARLEVLATLKGEDAAYLEIPFPGDLICPGPPQYRQGQTVVAFLNRGEDHQLRTVALSYGTLYGRDESELEDLEEMTRMAVELHSAGLSAPALAERKRAWVIEAAARPGTRWHGLYELEPRTERMRKFGSYPPQPVGLVIEKKEQAVLADAFLLADEPDDYSPELLQMLDGYEDPRVEAAALGWIEGLLALDQPPYVTRGLIETVLLRGGVGNPDDWMTDEKGEETFDIAPGRLRQIWSKAKEHLSLPTVSPRQVDGDRL